VRTPLVTTLLLILFCSAGTAHAIELEGVGVKAGGAFLTGNFSFEGRDAIDDDTRIGLVAGAFTEWKLQRDSAFRVVVEGLYVRKGYEGTRSIEAIDDEPIDVQVGADYLSIPVLGRVLFVDEELSVYALFGPSLELLLSNDEDPLLDELTDWSIAGNVAIGLEYAIADPARLLFELRFNTDLTDNFDGDDDLLGINEARYQMLQVTGGIRY